jgi:hypothetical protein
MKRYNVTLSGVTNTTISKIADHKEEAIIMAMLDVVHIQARSNTELEYDSISVSED